jgi:transcriptional regulator with XRE-family HTH domain
MEDMNFCIGPLMKAARKFKKFNQADVAQAIGCSQSALSKMEHNLLVPSAPQWFLFARFTAIPPETLETGVIDRNQKVKFNNDQVSLGFKIPKKYRHFRSEKVREIYPFLQYMEKKISPPVHKEFLTLVGLDSEFFLDFDNLINFQMIVDAMEFLIKQNKSSPSEILGLARFGQNDTYWDHYGIEWKKVDNIPALLNEFTNVQVFFQADFQIKVETSGGRTTISYFPEYHLKQLAALVSAEVINFLNDYRIATMENLIERVLNQKAKIELMAEANTSPLGARFEVKPIS